MKKFGCALILLAFSLKLFSQQTPSPKVDYLEKSKKQKTTAWLLLGGGFLITGITAAANSGVCVGPGCAKKKFPIVPVTIGGVAMASSIPFFIASSKNKRKAVTLSLKRELVPLPEKQNWVIISVPSVNVKLNL